MTQTSIIATAIVAIALGSAARAASFTGVINFSSDAGGGVELQNAGGIFTTDILEAAGIQSWLFLPQVDTRSGTFISVTEGQSVSMQLPWIFTPSTPVSPL